MTDKKAPEAPLAVFISKKVDGIDMGVASDGTAYLTGRAIADLCGVAASAVINRRAEWEEGKRATRFAKMLRAHGFEDDEELRLRLAVNRDAYSDKVATAFLEYYAFESTVKNDTALANFRKLVRGGLRLFIYRALGYDPSHSVPDDWRQFHDRLLLHTLPPGYFSVFKESADIVIASIGAGLPVDEKTVPDISIGKGWSSYWKAENLEDEHGPRKKHDHNYPDYFPQSASNPQEMHVYPIDALPDFRRWMERDYLPIAFPKYLEKRVKLGLMPPSAVEMVLTKVLPDGLPDSD
jgi:hypothetical protein